MSSRASVTPLYLEPQPSRRLARWQLWSHLASIALLIGLAWFTLWPLTLVPLVAASYRHCRHAALIPLHIALEADGSWLWHASDGSVRPVQLQPDTLLTPWLVILNLREERGRRHSVLLLDDSLPAEQFRALRVALRLARL